MRLYEPYITLQKNGRGIWDLDVSKGCSSGMTEKGGCYGECYAAKSATRRGIDFSTTVLRRFKNKAHQAKIIREINRADMKFIRIGCSGDPSENWEHTFSILRKISSVNKEIVLITKHWTEIPDRLLHELCGFNVCINTSVSALSVPTLTYCVDQFHRLKPFCKSVLRIVSCDFNKENSTGLRLSKIQDQLFKNDPVIDTVFRVSRKSHWVTDGIINVAKSKFMGSVQYISKRNRKTYLGKCGPCKDQCGIFNESMRVTNSQLSLI